VTINILNLNDEKPAFGAVASNTTPPENVMSADVAENATGDDLDVASYTATDADGDSATLSFTIGVEADYAPSFGDGTQDNLEFNQNTPIEPVMLPEATGGDGGLTYEADGLPMGLTLTGRELSGTPTGPGDYAVTYKVMDEDGDYAEPSLTFMITVLADQMPTFGDAMIDDVDYVENMPITDMTLPAAMSGDPPLTYSLTPELPAGLAFDATTRVLSGTPTEPMAATEYTYMVTDVDGDSAMLTFEITVAADLAPSFAGLSIPPRIPVRQNTPIPTLELPPATGGDGELIYTLTPEVPGLVFDDEMRMLSGTPTTVGQYPMSYRATDADGDYAELTTLLVVAPNGLPVANAGPDQTVNEGDQVTLDGSGSRDPDGAANPLSYSWEQVGATGISLEEAGAVRSMFMAPESTSTDDVVLEFELTVSDGMHSDSDRVKITVTSETAASLNRVNQELLPYLARTAVDNVTARIAHRAQGVGSAGTMDMMAAATGLASHLSSKGTGSISVQELIDGAAFVVPLADGDVMDDGGINFAVWGGVDYSILNAPADEPAIDWDGTVLSLGVGADVEVSDDFVAGLGVAHSRGSFEYVDETSRKFEGEYTGVITSAHPYVAWSPGGGGLWATVGYGLGSVEVTSDNVEDGADSTLNLLTGSMGVHFDIVENAVQLKGSGSVTRVSVADKGPIEEFDTWVAGGSAAVDAGTTIGLASGMYVTPSAELGVRYDTGAGEDGFGTTLGGGLDFSLGDISVEAHGRAVLGGESFNLREWTIGGSLTFSPVPDKMGMASVSPSAGVTLSHESTTYTVGSQFELMPGFSLTATGERVESTDSVGHTLNLTGQISY
jgi:hypothetical protein